MHDPVGLKTLRIMAEATDYNDWIYAIVKPFIAGSVAEVGAGTGTFSGLIVQDGYRVTAIDYNPDYLATIANKDSKIDTFLFDMQSKSLPTALVGKFDTVITLNVLEHLSDHALAMSHIHSMLKSGGTLIILVPSHQIAFGSLDKHLGHFRRYSKSSLTRLVTASRFKVVSNRYINMLGLLGWLLNSRLFKRNSLSPYQVRIFNFVSKPFLALEKHISAPFGLSLITIAHKI